MIFCRHLRALRGAAGLSRADLARRAGVMVSALAGWERDRGFPSLGASLRLAEVLGVSVERLADGAKAPGEDKPCRYLRRPAVA
jgi:transcriptional regulator with XRE-family HTH domain